MTSYYTLLISYLIRLIDILSYLISYQFLLLPRLYLPFSYLSYQDLYYLLYLLTS